MSGELPQALAKRRRQLKVAGISVRHRGCFRSKLRAEHTVAAPLMLANRFDIGAVVVSWASSSSFSAILRSIFPLMSSTKRGQTKKRFIKSDAKLPLMPLLVILIILVVLFGGGGYYMGPGIGYYGGGGISLVLALIVIYLLFGRGRERL
jgi:hypothetical protein